MALREQMRPSPSNFGKSYSNRGCILLAEINDVQPRTAVRKQGFAPRKTRHTNKTEPDTFPHTHTHLNPIQIQIRPRGFLKSLDNTTRSQAVGYRTLMPKWPAKTLAEERRHQYKAMTMHERQLTSKEPPTAMTTEEEDGG